MGFESIVGHDRQKRMLLSLLETGHLPQAFLFAGQDGVGKKKVALEFVKHMFCEKGTGCGLCRQCQNVERGSHPDLLLVRGETSIGIDQSRMVSKEICEHPYEADRRAIIIDGAEIMTTEAANALLKTLEEPPPFNIFFLITSSESDIPLTIRSRCNRIAFSPLTKEQLTGYFLRFFEGDEERTGLFAHISYGSIKCGLFWTEGENFEARRRIAEVVTGKARGLTNISLVAEKAAKSTDSMYIYLSFLQSLFRDLYVLRLARSGAVITNRDVRDLLEPASVDSKWIERSLRRIRESFTILQYNVNRWLAFESLLLDITR